MSTFDITFTDTPTGRQFWSKDKNGDWVKREFITWSELKAMDELTKV